MGSQSAPREGGYVVELERFQGPLDLLLHLIRQQEMDIFDIPIALITEQFLQAIQGLGPSDLDSAGEFLEMAATLVRIKAQFLLPRPEMDEDGDPRAELVRRLLEYEQVREVAERLARAEADRSRCFARGFVPPRQVTPEASMSLETTWDEVWASALAVSLPEPRKEEHRVTPRTVSMDARVTLILERLVRVSSLAFRTLIAPGEGKMHGVMTFLAGLELTRRRAIRLRQRAPFEELWLLRRDDRPDEDEGVNAR
jgi:segregation and condensation protein A